MPQSKNSNEVPFSSVCCLCHYIQNPLQIFQLFVCLSERGWLATRCIPLSNPSTMMVEKENLPVTTLVKRNLALRRIVSASSSNVCLS